MVGFRREARRSAPAAVALGTAAEKVVESILEDLFSDVLDWSIGEVNNQVGYAELLLTRLGTWWSR